MICAIVVTYNRKELLVRNIKALIDQSVKPDILIYDNCSTDGTREYLIQENVIDERGNGIYAGLTYYCATSNSGGAGGFSNGLKMAMANDYDAYMLMDDDGYPVQSDCMEDMWNQLCQEKDQRIILNPVVQSIDKGDNRLCFSVFGCKTVDELLEKAGNHDVLYGEIAPFNGTFLSRAVVQEIGVPLQELFIYGDEFEYTKRAVSKGIRLGTCSRVVYYHPCSLPQMRKIMGKEIEYRELTPWKTYYFVRNYEYIFRQYCGRIETWVHSAKIICKSLLYQEDRGKKIRITVKALRDGYRGDLSKNQTNCNIDEL